MNVQHVCVHARSVLSCTMQAAVSSTLFSPSFYLFLFSILFELLTTNWKKKIDKNKQIRGILWNIIIGKLCFHSMLSRFYWRHMKLENKKREEEVYVCTIGEKKKDNRCKWSWGSSWNSTRARYNERAKSIKSNGTRRLPLSSSRVYASLYQIILIPGAFSAS